MTTSAWWRRIVPVACRVRDFPMFSSSSSSVGLMAGFVIAKVESFVSIPRVINTRRRATVWLLTAGSARGGFTSMRLLLFDKGTHTRTHYCLLVSFAIPARVTPHATPHNIQASNAATLDCTNAPSPSPVSGSTFGILTSTSRPPHPDPKLFTRQGRRLACA